MTFTAQEKPRIVSEFIRNQSVARMQRSLRMTIQIETPTRNMILRRHD